MTTDKLDNIVDSLVRNGICASAEEGRASLDEIPAALGHPLYKLQHKLLIDLVAETAKLAARVGALEAQRCEP